MTTALPESAEVDCQLQRDVANAVIAALYEHTSTCSCSTSDRFCLLVTAQDHPEAETGLVAAVLDAVRAWHPTGHKGEWAASIVGYRVQPGTPGVNTSDSPDQQR
jgi:hypothetical protein